MLKTVEFQVNLHFGKHQVSACGYNKTASECILVLAPNLPMLLKRIKKKMGLKLEQIVLTFQPEHEWGIHHGCPCPHHSQESA